MITEPEVQKAAAFIRDNAGKLATAKAEMKYLHEFRKSKKAILINAFEGKGTGQEKEAFAYAHPEYLQVLEGYRAAIEEYEGVAWLMEAAKIKIEIWRSEQANNRMIDKSHQ